MVERRQPLSVKWPATRKRKRNHRAQRGQFLPARGPGRRNAGGGDSVEPDLVITRRSEGGGTGNEATFPRPARTPKRVGRRVYARDNNDDDGRAEKRKKEKKGENTRVKTAGIGPGPRNEREGGPLPVYRSTGSEQPIYAR